MATLGVILLLSSTVGVYSFCSNTNISICPVGCECNELFVYCEKVGLPAPPRVLPGNVTYVHLGSNIIREIRADDFQGCTSLRVLHLELNCIRMMHPGALQDLTGITELYLHGNSLQSVEWSLPSPLFFPMVSEHGVNISNQSAVIDLSYNLLATLRPELMMEFDTISERNLLVLDLSQNHLECSCNNVDFLEWVMVTKVKLLDWRNYTCTKDGEVLRFTELRSQIVPQLQIVCSGDVLLIVTTSSAVVLIVVVMVSVCLYRRRWDIRYFCLKLSRGRKGMQLLAECKYEYDAFVCYDSGDADWVVNCLLPKLEDAGPQPGFRLCLHHRDWNPGTPIAENILSSIESSRKVILVLSKQFAQSHWCEFETHIARVRSLEQRLDLIVPILKEDIPVELMSRTVRHIVRTRTYLEWPSVADVSPTHKRAEEFWERLRAALRSPGDRPLVCECGRKYFYLESDIERASREGNDIQGQRSLSS